MEEKGKEKRREQGKKGMGEEMVRRRREEEGEGKKRKRWYEGGERRGEKGRGMGIG
jgi:hypothetical protein